MIRRSLTIVLAIAALSLAMVASASAATPHHRGTVAHHVTRTHHRRGSHRARRTHHRRTAVHSNGVTRAVAHNDPIAVTAVGVHHVSDPVAVGV